MKILITGSNGLLGNSLCTNLERDGHEIFAITRGDSNKDYNGSINYINIDFSKIWDVTQLPEKVDIIIHLAQSSKFREFPNGALDIFKVNIESTAKLLDYAVKVGVQNFIYASSGGIYGNGNNAFNESSPIISPGKLGYYLGSKASGEILAQSYSSFMNVIVHRFFFIYGPGQNRTMLIPRLMDNISNNITIQLNGNTGIRINPIHVEDATASVIKSLFLKSSATFNIAGPEVLSISEICEGMGNYMNIKPIFKSTYSENISDLIGDITEMENLLIRPTRKILNSLNEIKK